MTDATLAAPPPFLEAQRPGRRERWSLRVVQFGAVAAMLVSATMFPFELDRFFVPKELALHLTALLASLPLLGSARRASATRVDLLLLAVLALGLVSTLLATNHWVAARSLGIAASSLALFWTARMLRAAGLGRPLLGALAFAAMLAVATALAQAYGLRTELFSINRAPGGSLGNRNFVAHLSAISLPLLLLTVVRARRATGFFLALLGICVSAAALVLTRSRAGWLGAGVVVLVLLLGWLATPSLRRHGRSWLRLAAILPLIGSGVTAAVLLPNQLRWRSDSPYLETARRVVDYQGGSGRGRLIQYRNSLEMTLHNPLFGAGPGNWAVEYADFADNRDPSMDPSEGGATSNPWPSSDWVALLAERGVPAFALLVLAWVALSTAAWRGMRTALAPEEGIAALTLLAMLAGAAVVGMFDAVLLLAWPAFLFWTAAGALLPPGAARPVEAIPAARAAAFLLVVVLVAASAVRSGAQLAGMWIYTARDDGPGLELATRLDPGSYRTHLRAARYYGRGNGRYCDHARNAHRLYPNAASARAMARRCR